MLLTDKYNYLGLPPELEDGIQVMTGICCCRHANNISFNILRQLGYDCKKTFFYVNNETGTWHEKTNALGTNHIATSIQTTEKRIILDIYNDLIFSTANGKTESLRQELTPEEMMICRKYNDEENITPIAKTLKKYYQLRELGITHVYDDEEYGEY